MRFKSIDDLPPRLRVQVESQTKYAETEVVSVTLRVDLMSANQLQRAHWTLRGKLRTDYRNHLYAAGAIRREAPKGKQRVTITRVLGPRQRRFDPDNLHASIKGLLDAMRDNKLIADDSPAHIDLVVLEDAGARAHGPAVRVRVEPA